MGSVVILPHLTLKIVCILKGVGEWITTAYRCATDLVKMWTTRKLEVITVLVTHTAYEELLTILDKYLDLSVIYVATVNCICKND